MSLLCKNDPAAEALLLEYALIRADLRLHDIIGSTPIYCEADLVEGEIEIRRRGLSIPSGE